MKQTIMFWLARIFGTPHTRDLPQKDGAQITLIGYRWRNTFFAADMKYNIVDPIAHKNAMAQALGRKAPKGDERRIFLPGGRR